MTDTVSDILSGNRQEFAKQLEDAERSKEEALILLSQETLASVRKIVDIRDNGTTQYALDAAKYLVKLSGLEVERLKLNEAADEQPLMLVVKRFDKKPEGKANGEPAGGNKPDR